jgi:hypothetical protein
MNGRDFLWHARALARNEQLLVELIRDDRAARSDILHQRRAVLRRDGGSNETDGA